MTIEKTLFFIGC